MATTPIPSWMDVYNKHKESTGNFGGKGVNAWNQDQTHMDTKKRFDDEYLANLASYNTANGTSHQADQTMLGYNVNPNTDWHDPVNNVDQKGGYWGEHGKDWMKAAALAAAVYGGGAALGAWGGGGAAAGAAGAGTAAGTAGASGGLSSMYSLAGGTGTLGAGSAASTATAIGTAGAAGMGGAGGLTLAGAGGGAGLAAMGGATGLAATAAGTGAGTASTLGTVNNVMGAVRGVGGLVRDVGSLYTAYRGSQAADANQTAIQDQMRTLNDMYKEGSPWAEQLKEQLARKDAAAGRNSQYGPRLAQYQAMLADKAGQNAGVLGNLATASNTANTNSNQFQNLVLNRLTGLADSTGLTRRLDGAINNGVSSVWDSFFGD